MDRGSVQSLDPQSSIIKAIRSAKSAGGKRLDLSCGLTQFPDEIYELADTLEILNLSGNALSRLPCDLPRLHKLRVIFCSDNQFTHVPDVLGQCPKLEMVGFKANRISHLSAASLPLELRWLILTDNQLSELPAKLGSCTRLQKLMLAGNQLQHLPDLVACRNLELLRICANRLQSLPDWLLTLPRLAWLAFAGNPLEGTVENSMVDSIAWDRLDLKHKLGEGASGVIHQAIWQHEAGGEIPVAVKLFKGSVTSDGLPRCEKAACIAAGVHPNLISAFGKISAHPDGVAGLVMPLVSADFTNLSGPPSLESCTRDIYSAQTQFYFADALAIARGIAAAAEHLHRRGVMHGDLYAHNILWNGGQDCLLGDFGAATLLSGMRQAVALERIEVRAFGCLLEELLERCHDPQAASLWNLQRRCFDLEVAARPSFTDIRQILDLHAA